jgi:hypothetical protein
MQGPSNRSSRQHPLFPGRATAHKAMYLKLWPFLSAKPRESLARGYVYLLFVKITNFLTSRYPVARAIKHVEGKGRSRLGCDWHLWGNQYSTALPPCS